MVTTGVPKSLGCCILFMSIRGNDQGLTVTWPDLIVCSPFPMYFVLWA